MITNASAPRRKESGGSQSRAVLQTAAYPAGTGSAPRSILVKREVHRLGTQRRLLGTHRAGPPPGLYQGCSAQRGDVPASPLGALTTGRAADRRSARGFPAQALRWLEYVRASASGVLYGAAAASVPEVAQAAVSTLRQRRGKVGAVVKTRARRSGFDCSASGPFRAVWLRVQQAVLAAVDRWQRVVVPPAALPLTPR